MHLLRRRLGAPDERVTKHLDRIANEAAIATAIIADLLGLARDRPPDCQPTDVGALVHEAVDRVPRPAEVTVEVRIAPDLPRASLDPLQIRQVLLNLVLNSVQSWASAGRAAAHVIVSARSQSEHALVLRVDDDGPGLAPEVAEHLFEPLVTTRATGVGLGLALCRRIVEKHGGTIRGGNRDEGGAWFELVLYDALEREGSA